MRPRGQEGSNLSRGYRVVFAHKDSRAVLATLPSVIAILHRSPMDFRMMWSLCWMQVLVLAGTATAAQQSVGPSSRETSPLPTMVEQHCAGCHNSATEEGKPGPRQHPAARRRATH